MVGDPFGHAWALLALGVVRGAAAARSVRPARRSRRLSKGSRRSVPRAGRRRRGGELGRVGGRKRESGLTAAERRVAALVAEGRTNREVAAVLFLGERT